MFTLFKFVVHCLILQLKFSLQGMAIKEELNKSVDLHKIEIMMLDADLHKREIMMLDADLHKIEIMMLDADLHKREIMMLDVDLHKRERS